jgi:hypothetical protein
MAGRIIIKINNAGAVDFSLFLKITLPIPSSFGHFLEQTTFFDPDDAKPSRSAVDNGVDRDDMLAALLPFRWAFSLPPTDGAPSSASV